MVEDKRIMTNDVLAAAESSGGLKSCFRGVRWVWLDLDDTLIDFRANSLAALSLTYGHCGLSRYFSTCAEWVDSYMRHNHQLWERYDKAEITQAYLRVHRFLDPINERAHVGEEEFASEAGSMDAAYLDILARQKAMMPGAMELVEALRARNYNIGILSNGFADVQHRKLRTVGLDALVDAVVLSDDIGVNKPDRRLYIHAMQRAGDRDPARHLMIGDNPSTDIAGAIGAGWRAILYAPRTTVVPAADCGCVVTSLLSLLPIL